MTYVFGSQLPGEIVTLAEAKSFLRVTFTEEDTLISSLIVSSTIQAEQYMRRNLLTTTWTNYRSSFHEDLTLRRGGFQSVESIEYLLDGTYQTLATTEYEATIGGSYGVICRVDPVGHDEACNAVKITFKTGFGDDPIDVPENIKIAIRFNVASLYVNRGDCSDACGVGIPESAKAIYNKYKLIDIVGGGRLGYL